MLCEFLFQYATVYKAKDIFCNNKIVAVKKVDFQMIYHFTHYTILFAHVSTSHIYAICIHICNQQSGAVVSFFGEVPDGVFGRQNGLERYYCYY